MSQHEVFEQHIKDLGNIYLTLTRIIEKKKESFNRLKINKKSQGAYASNVSLQHPHPMPTTIASYSSKKNYKMKSLPSLKTVQG